MVKDDVERFRVEPWDIRYADMKPDPDGEWVRYSDYAALSARLAEARARLDDMLDYPPAPSG